MKEKKKEQAASEILSSTLFIIIQAWSVFQTDNQGTTRMCQINAFLRTLVARLTEYLNAIISYCRTAP